jgi:hypothetical protein
MATNTKSMHRATVSLQMPAKVADFIAYGTGIVHAMTGNPWFPAPVPTLTALSAALSDLQTAETLALTKAKGTAQARDDKRAIVVSLVQQLRGHVQAVADATPENGATIIQSAGLPVRKIPLRAARVFAAKPGVNSGSVKLTATVSARRASYEWQYSIDGGKTWVGTPSSLQAKTTIVGLATGITAMFRFKTVIKTGESDWSQPVALLVK